MIDTEERLEIDTGHGTVSGLWAWEPHARAAIVIGHGAGVSMDAPFLAGFAANLNESTIGTLRFNFPYMEKGRRSPDPAPVLLDAFRAAFEAARERIGGKRLFAGGKSMGGRIASMAVADGMPATGLVFIGYPLHPPGKPDRLRDQHLYGIKAPMLFLQGTNDAFARFDLITDLTERLGRWAILHPVEGADHSFRVRGTKSDEVATGRLLASVAVRFIQTAVF